MPVLDPPRQAATDLLDLLGEVAGAATIAITDAMARARGPGAGQGRLQLVPTLNPNSGNGPRVAETERGSRVR